MRTGCNDLADFVVIQRLHICLYKDLREIFVADTPGVFEAELETTHIRPFEIEVSG